MLSRFRSRSAHPARSLLVAVGLLAAAAALAEGVPAGESACDVPAATDRLEGMSVAGEIRLGSGATVRLADIRIPDGERRPETWLASLAGRPVLVAAGPTDRWGRQPARLALPDDVKRDGTAPIEIAELLVGEGFALVDAGEADALCRPELLALEARARERRLGLWAEDAALPRPAADGPALAAQAGRFVIVEGRVASVGERAQRTYLNFGRAGTGAFTLTIPKRNWSLLRRRGVSAESLRGAHVRARGLVEMWRGPVMEIVAADMLEILAAAPVSRR